MVKRKVGHSEDVTNSHIRHYQLMAKETGRTNSGILLEHSVLLCVTLRRDC